MSFVKSLRNSYFIYVFVLSLVKYPQFKVFLPINTKCISTYSEVKIVFLCICSFIKPNIFAHILTFYSSFISHGCGLGYSLDVPVKPCCLYGVSTFSPPWLAIVSAWVTGRRRWWDPGEHYRVFSDMNCDKLSVNNSTRVSDRVYLQDHLPLPEYRLHYRE